MELAAWGEGQVEDGEGVPSDEQMIVKSERKQDPLLY